VDLLIMWIIAIVFILLLVDYSDYER